MNSVENVDAAGDDERLATFNQSPITQGVGSSADISPGKHSFGFEMQQVRQEESNHKNQDGLGKLIEQMDQDQLRQSYGHSRQKSIKERADEKTRR